MTNLFTRLKDMITADLHQAMDHKEKKNPIALLNQYLRQCEQETEKVRKLLERQYSLKDEFTRELRFAKEMADKRKHQSLVAQKAGETTLFEFASQEQSQYEERVVRLENSLQMVQQQLNDLEKKYEDMKHKLKDMNIRRLELMGRENVTRANHRMDKVLDSNQYSDRSFSRFEEIENYLDRLEHQVNSSYFRNTIDAKIAQLEKEMKVEQTHSIS
ncbi:PspA/IM30 family protein [Bacillus sp. CGMCC 1.16607]|uniref:PspA/IM30 family protein n=1 Tax=Bacillus sp. CGMCC 1.16607 TaxID=3351842 RepID=UPI003644306A